jgi:hypothetical protein
VRSLWPLVLVAASATAAADDGPSIRLRHLSETDAEPYLHLDALTPEAAIAEGGIVDRQAAVIDLGPRAHLAAEGMWWQTGLAPSMFTEDLQLSGWRVGGELSYDVGPFRVGVNASMTREGDSAHRMVGLFAYRTFGLSRWMHAWIMLGIAYEQFSFANAGSRQGTHVGLSIGTTFR